MKVNMGNLDRLLRLLAAALMMALVFTDLVSGTWSYVLIGLSAVFSLTSLIRICPLYIAFDISTNKKQ